ncbi:hypothetical protein HD554DRAFT_2041168 [Boletus coccyginus]|nr:hypothetical protein HD554DRAFT_2041168 [Boletus coccyginus]
MSLPSSGQHYKMVGRLNRGVDNAINCLAINGQGTFLTGGSNDGMKIWKMDKLEEIPLVAWHHIQFKEVTLKWIGTSCEITCMACDTTQRASVYIAAVTREHHIVVWTFEGNLLTPTLSVQLNTTVPKGITFSGQNDLQVWGMYNGLIDILQCKLTIQGDGCVVKSTELSTTIGGVALHEK